jgi:hypothetical protein
VVHQKEILAILAILPIACNSGIAEEAKPPAAAVQVPLVVSSGVPLRVYATKRVRMRKGEPVQAKLIDPIYAFDRVVVPSGAELQGHVTELDSVSRMKRLQSILNGDFTPLHFARAEFTNVLMPDGRSLPLHTIDSQGLPSIYSPPRPNKKPRKDSQPRNTGVLGTTKNSAQQELQRQISAKTQGVVELVRSPNRKEWLEDYLIKKLPYHPQWYRRNTRFDAVLSAPLDFGIVPVSGEALSSVGMPLGESWGQVRLLTELSSADADTNTQVNGVLSQPVFSAEHKLILPEGTRLTGRVRKAQAARWFHRGGQLRFTFDHVEPPSFLAVQPMSIERTPVLLSAVEPDGRGNVKVGPEGDAKATESKSRLLGPALALIVASRAADNDAEHHGGATGTPTGNYGGRTLGGFSGFGLLGSAAAQSSKTLGAALGYYGLGWSVYSTIISRGNEVEFRKNAAIDVRFGAESTKPEKKVDSHFTSGSGSEE